MDMLRLLRQAIDYIEDNLHTAIEIDDIAKAAVTSKYHFQRMFHALTGLTVTEYAVIVGLHFCKNRCRV